MEIIPLQAGAFRVDGGVMFGATPKSTWSSFYEETSSNLIPLAMRCILIHTSDNHHILVDTGVGDKHIEDATSYEWFQLKHVLDCLNEIHFSPDSITDVILTHLHFDHCGGCTQKNKQTGQYNLCFPNARHWVSRSQWDNFQSPHPLEAESFYLDDMELVHKSGKLILIDKETEICPNVSLSLFDGHTPGQIAVFLLNKDQTIIIPGDVIPMMPYVNPYIISAYDLSPLQSYDAKLKILEEAVNKHAKLYYYHDINTVSSFITRDDKGTYSAVDLNQ